MKEKESKNAAAVIKDIRRRTKCKFSSEEKIRIVISGLRSDESITPFTEKKASHQHCIIDGAKTS